MVAMFFCVAALMDAAYLLQSSPLESSSCAHSRLTAAGAMVFVARSTHSVRLEARSFFAHRSAGDPYIAAHPESNRIDRTASFITPTPLITSFDSSACLSGVKLLRTS